MIKMLLNQKQTIIGLKLGFWSILFLLVYLTLTPTPPKPFTLNNIDKFYHFTAFAGFTFFFTAAYRQYKNLTIILLSIALGILIEVIQYYIPDRGFSIADMFADALGVFVGCWIARKMI